MKVSVMFTSVFSLLAVALITQAAPDDRKVQLDVVKAFPQVPEALVAGCTRQASGDVRCDASVIVHMDSAGTPSGVTVGSVKGVNTEKECHAALTSARPAAKKGKNWKDGKVAPVSTTFFVEEDLLLATQWANYREMGKFCAIRICNQVAMRDYRHPYCRNLKERMDSL